MNENTKPQLVPAWLKADCDEALADLAAGRTVPVEQVLAELRVLIDDAVKARRSEQGDTPAP